MAQNVDKSVVNDSFYASVCNIMSCSIWLKSDFTTVDMVASQNTSKSTELMMAVTTSPAVIRFPASRFVLLGVML